MFKDPITSWLLKPITDKIESNDIELREKMLDIEHDVEKFEPYIQMYTNLMKDHELYKARMSKYEWIETLLQSASRFFRYLLPKHKR